MLATVPSFVIPEVSFAHRTWDTTGQFFVGTPAVWMEQGAAYGNELERHMSLWRAEELRGAGFEVLDDGEIDRFGNQMLLAVGEYDSPACGRIGNLPPRR